MNTAILLNPGLVDGYGNVISTTYDPSTDTTKIMTQADVPNLPAVGQKTMASSVPVVVASDQSAITVQGVGLGGWIPSTPVTYFGIGRGDLVPLGVAPDGNLATYSQILTDAGSFRDDYIEELTYALTGTVTFTNGSTEIVGSGTAFTTELDRFSYIRHTDHIEETYASVARVIDDEHLILWEPYSGVTASGIAIRSAWLPVTNGGSISVANSFLTVSSGTSDGYTYTQRGSDYGPMTKTARFNVSQRISNQTIRLGFFDDFENPKYQACIELTGTDNTQISLVTRSGYGPYNIESVTVALPAGVTTNNDISLKLDALTDIINLYYVPDNSSETVLLASCKTHILPAYFSVMSGHGIINNGTVESNTELNIDMVFLNNYNLLKSSTETTGNRLSSKVIQDIITSTVNSSTENLGPGESFTGIAELTTGANSIQTTCYSDQPIEFMLQQSMDGYNWDIYDCKVFVGHEGDSRTYQASANYFRIVATNVSGWTTTEFRLSTFMCPVATVLPRSLTQSGKLPLATMTTSWSPSPYNFQDDSESRALSMDTDRSLKVRANVLTDAASFRDDFTSGSLFRNISGTLFFTNGSSIVTGNSTSFFSELSLWDYLKLSVDGYEHSVLISEILSDTYLVLDSEYGGSTGGGSATSSYWIYSAQSSDGYDNTLSQYSSEILLGSGTKDGGITRAVRVGDYLPYVIGYKARISQRIANQEIHFGLADATNEIAQNQALIVFDGTDNTKCKLVSSFSSSDIETTTVTLPGGAITSSSNIYQLEVMNSKVSLFINGTKKAEHLSHIPGPYSPMDCHICSMNRGTAASSTTLAVDMFFLTNFDQVNVTTSSKGDPISIKEIRAGSSEVTSVSAAITDTSLLTSNSNRMGAAIVNDSTATLYLKLGTGASTTSHTVQIPRGGYYEVPFGYTGSINGIWSAGTGSARITEIIQ